MLMQLLWIRPCQNHCFEKDRSCSQICAEKWDFIKLPTTFLTLISVWSRMLMEEPYNSFASGCFGGFWYPLGMWGEAFLSCLGGITENHCWGFDVKECRDVKDPNLPSKGNDMLSLAIAVLYSVQSSCKCVIWMSVLWAHYLHRKHICFQVKYFQKAVLLLSLYSSSLSSMKNTNHEKSLYFKWLHWNNFVLVFLKGERNAPPLPQL